MPALARPWTTRDVYQLCGQALPWAVRASVLFLALGAWWAVAGPVEASAARFSLIALLHVPMAWLSVLLCISMAFWAAFGLVLERPMALLLAQATAPTGGMCAFLALLSGGLWSKALDGAWWSAEPRELAELVLLIWYLGILGIPIFVDRLRIADRLAALLAVAGVANVSVLFFGAEWLSIRPRGSGHAYGVVGAVGEGLLPAIACFAIGLWFYATAVVLMRFRCALLQRYAAA